MDEGLTPEWLDLDLYGIGRDAWHPKGSCPTKEQAKEKALKAAEKLLIKYGKALLKHGERRVKELTKDYQTEIKFIQRDMDRAKNQ